MARLYVLTLLACALTLLSAGGAAAQSGGPFNPPPDPPTGFRMTPTHTPGTVTLSWNASVEHGDPLTGYMVYDDPDWVTICQTPSGSVLECTVGGLTPGASYSFMVFAQTDANEGGFSETLTFTAPDVPSAPSSPVATASGGNTAQVSWTESASDHASAISEYTATASPGGERCHGYVGDPVCEVSGLERGTEYTFKVVATNAVGDSLASSLSSPVTTWDLPDAPTAVTAVAGIGQAVVSFTAPNDNGAAITAYTVTSSPAGATCSPTGGETSCVIAGLDPGTSYTFTAVATNAVGAGAVSEPSSPVSPLAPPPVIEPPVIEPPGAGPPLSGTTPAEIVPQPGVEPPAPGEPKVDAPVPPAARTVKPLQVQVGDATSADAVAAAAQLKLTARSKVRLTIAAASRGVCVVKSGRLVAKRSGSCSVQVRVAGRRSSAKVVVRVVKRKSVTRLAISGR